MSLTTIKHNFECLSQIQSLKYCIMVEKKLKIKEINFDIGAQFTKFYYGMIIVHSVQKPLDLIKMYCSVTNAKNGSIALAKLGQHG